MTILNDAYHSIRHNADRAVAASLILGALAMPAFGQISVDEVYKNNLQKVDDLHRKYDEEINRIKREYSNLDSNRGPIPPMTRDQGLPEAYKTLDMIMGMSSNPEFQSRYKDPSQQQIMAQEGARALIYFLADSISGNEGKILPSDGKINKVSALLYDLLSRPHVIAPLADKYEGDNDGNTTDEEFQRLVKTFEEHKNPDPKTQLKYPGLDQLLRIAGWGK